MNYYIQGDAANADRIKAAFERNGIDTSANSNYGISNLFYFSCNGDVAVTQNGSIINIIKTHPDYKELELPVEPKFKKGDWIACDADSFTLSIKSVKDGNYYFHQGASLPIKDIDEHYHLWTIADAKDGDVICTPNDNIFIYKCKGSGAQIYDYCGLYHGKFEPDSSSPNGAYNSCDGYAPATKEQRDLLFQKMKEAGYQWDADKKELRKIKPHYDIANFQPKQWVLVRDDDEWEWALTMFSYLSNGSASLFVCINGASFQQCIPFEGEGNEHLLGTTDMCDERFINW